MMSFGITSRVNRYMRQLHCSERVSNECTSQAHSSSYLSASKLCCHLWTTEAFSPDFYPKASRDEAVMG